MREVRNRSFNELVEAALRQMAEKKVDERAKATGTPLVLWENGKVKKVDPRKWTYDKRKVAQK